MRLIDEIIWGFLSMIFIEMNESQDDMIATEAFFEGGEEDGRQSYEVSDGDQFRSDLSGFGSGFGSPEREVASDLIGLCFSSSRVVLFN
jgi:hypothetical protein